MKDVVTLIALYGCIGWRRTCADIQYRSLCLDNVPGRYV